LEIRAEAVLRRIPALFPLLAIFVSLVFALPASPQSAANQNSTPVYKAHARDVIVDVVVTQHNDEPVRGLHAKDFVVTENGHPQTIDYFEEHASGPLPADALKPLPKMPPGVYTNVPPAPQSDAVNVLLIDSLNTEPQDQSFVRQQLLTFLKSMQPGTRAAIFALGSHLRYIQGFTVDTSKLIAAVNGTAPEKDAASRTRSDTDDDEEEVRTMIMELGGHRDAGVDALQGAQAQVAGSQYGNRIGITFQALQALARYLAAVPGRKNLLWFAGTYPVTVFPNSQERQEMARQHGFLGQVNETADLLTSSDIAVYPINAQGLMNSHVMEANQYEKPSMMDYGDESSERAGTIEGMEQLANDTGGKAFYNTNDLNGAMQHAIADGSNYYTISYSPTNKKMDGSFRRIEVKLPGTKYKLAYRRGYNADDTSTVDSRKQGSPLRGLMQPGMPDTTQILFAVRAVPDATQPPANAPRAGKNDKLSGPMKRYSVDFMIRWTDVKLDAAPDGKHSGKIEVELSAYDADGHPVNWEGATQVMHLDPRIYTAIQHSGVPAHMDIDLPTGKPVDLVAGVYDVETGKAGTMRVRLNP
jgi:VWFA-related protein